MRHRQLLFFGCKTALRANQHTGAAARQLRALLLAMLGGASDKITWRGFDASLSAP